jgi:DnaJ-class molecular chaperone
MSIIKKTLKNKCYCCEGKGKILKKKCPTCNGTGIFKDEIYYFINDKSKTAWDGDTLK